MTRARKTKKHKSGYDIAIVIALDEEFRHFELMAADRLTLLPGPKLEEPAWEFEFVTRTGEKRCGLVIVCNEMGPLKALDLTNTLLSRYSFDLLINAGISGSLRDDLSLGDIIIARDEIYDYSQQSKLIDPDEAGVSYQLKLGSRAINISNDAAIAFWTALKDNSEAFSAWQTRAELRLKNGLSQIIELNEVKGIESSKRCSEGTLRLFVRWHVRG